MRLSPCQFSVSSTVSVMAALLQLRYGRDRLRSRYRLGQVQLHRELWTEAEQQYRELLAEAQQAGWERQEAYSKLHLALALSGLARLDEAAALLTEAKDLGGKWKEPLLEGRAQLEQAKLESRCGGTESAVSLARSALTIFQRLGDRYDEIKTADLLAHLEITHTPGHSSPNSGSAG